MGERRSGSRIPAKDLPVILKKFKVDLGTGELLDSTTVDANRSGISLLVPIHIYKVKNYDITLHAVDRSFSIKDEIVYIKGISPEESRISIMFTSSSGLEKYYELLDTVK
ncbi:MAG: hypothetical protein PF693_17985 [Spirochaetia bacterium]|jgi:hypothetical protein|nr:hypothetical protein [Spirochaetia bacterium]